MADPELVELSGPDGMFTVTIPADWERIEPQDGMPFAAAEPDRGSPLRANLVVTLDEVTMSFKDWQLGTDQLLPGLLTEYHLLDLERLELHGYEAVRRLAHHTVADGAAAATMEQWAVLANGRGYTLTFTVPTMRYAAMAGGLADLVDRFRPAAEVTA